MLCAASKSMIRTSQVKLSKTRRGFLARPSSKAPSHKAHHNGAAREPLTLSIHGRHMEVTPELEQRVKDRLAGMFKKLESPEFLESEGGIKDVDVRLMSSQAEVTLHPQVVNKHLHDTFLQHGALTAIGQGSTDVYDNFDKAVEQLEKKLHKWDKGAPMKKDLRKM